MLDNIDNWDHF